MPTDHRHGPHFETSGLKVHGRRVLLPDACANVEYLKEVFELFGQVTARRMFGGYGLYHDGLMFGLVGYGNLYLKADAENAGHFEQQGLARFEYETRGKRVKLAYYLAPDEILEDREEAALWARRSFEAALRTAAAKTKPTQRESA